MTKNSKYNTQASFHAFVRSHNLTNRIFNMLVYFNLIKHPENSTSIKNFLGRRLEDVEYVELLAKFFEKKLSRQKRNIDLRCNLRDLIYDLDYLKQYLI